MKTWLVWSGLYLGKQWSEVAPGRPESPSRYSQDPPEE